MQIKICVFMSELKWFESKSDEINYYTFSFWLIKMTQIRPKTKDNSVHRYGVWYDKNVAIHTREGAALKV